MSDVSTSPLRCDDAGAAALPDAPRRPRLLMLAYACHPHWGSEPGMGWHRALEAARRCDTWIITRQSPATPAIKEYLRAHPDQTRGLHFVFVPSPRWEQWLRAVPGLYYLAYRCWQKRAFAVARRLHAEVDFDLTHQVTFGGYREPGYLWKLGVPFVWGPVGGTQNYPWRFLGQASLRGGAWEALRAVLNWCQLRFSPRVRQAARRAAVLLVGNSHAQREFKAIHQVEGVFVPGGGIADPLADEPSAGEDAASVMPCDGAAELRLLWSGVHEDHKALPLLLKALALLPGNLSYRLRVLGDGRRGAAWRRLAGRLGLAARIEWLGRLPHAAALAQYRWADVFVCTSLRDTMPTVVLEALAAGVPVLGLDHQGMGDAITEQCGVKVAVSTPRATIGRLAEALAALAGDPARRRTLADGARRRARRFLWSQQSCQLDAIYREILGPAPRSSAPAVHGGGERSHAAR